MVELEEALFGNGAGLGEVVGWRRDLSDRVEHGDAVVKPFDGGMWVDNAEVRVGGGLIVMELFLPRVVVQLVGDAIEGALVGEREGEVDRDEIQTSVLGSVDQRRENDALHLLRGKGVPNAKLLAPAPLTFRHFSFFLSPNLGRGRI